MKYPSLAIANAIYDLASKDGEPLTHMKLQKLVYITHGWALGIRSESLIDEDVMAWKYGPVIERLWHQFKEFGRQVLSRRAQIGTVEDGHIRFEEPEVPNSDDWTHALIDQIWKVYGKMSANQLSKLTHQTGTPWYTVAEAFNFSLPKNVIIPNNLIQEHYAKKWQDIQANQHQKT